MRVEIEIAEPDAELFGEDVPAKVGALVAREVLRLRHIVRCQPRPKGGRTSPATAKLGERLLEIYRRKRLMFEGNLPAYLQAQEQEVLYGMTNNDLVLLERMWKEQPWTRKS